MKFVSDTDILSIFGKIDRLDILSRLSEKIVVPKTVNEELIRANEMGFDFAEKVMEIVEVTDLSEKEFDEYNGLITKAKHLHTGELECFVIAKSRDYVLLTNERKVQNLCKGYNIEYLNLPRILRLALKDGILDKKELLELIKEIEEKDRTIIKNKENILKE